MNDLAMGGARPLYLTAAFILEEGFPLEDLERIVASMRRRMPPRRAWPSSPATPRSSTAARATASSSRPRASASCRRAVALIRRARPGDRILVSGTIGDHGIAILSVREGLEFETVLESDCAPLAALVRGRAARPAPRRAACATPRAAASPARSTRSPRPRRWASVLDESPIPVRPEVRGACEILGLDPLYVANEGKLVAIVPPEDRRACSPPCAPIRSGRTPRSSEVVANHAGLVTLRT